MDLISTIYVYTDFNLIECSLESGNSYVVSQNEVDDCKALYVFNNFMQISCIDQNNTQIQRLANTFTNYVTEGFGNLTTGATITANGNCDWVCLCSDTSVGNNTSYVELNGSDSINANIGLLVISGTGIANDGNGVIQLSKFDYMIPRQSSYTIQANNIKAFLIPV